MKERSEQVANTELRRRRLSSNLTQSQLAHRLKIHVSSYQRIEYGTRNPSLAIALKIAEALNTTVEELWSAAANKNNNN